jgi:hypothetical protein
VSRVGVVYPTRTLEVLVDADLDTLATALYVTTDDLLAAHPERVPARPRVGIAPKITDAELLTLAVMQALLGYTSETGWLRYARAHLAGMFPNLPGQSATTGGCASSPTPSPGWSASWPNRPASPATTCWWPTRRRSNAPDLEKP